MGTNHSRRHEDLALTKRRGRNKLKADITCPICSKVFIAKTNTYADFDSHIESHQTEEQNSTASAIIIPEDVYFPEAEAKILPIRHRLDNIRVPWSVAHLNITVTRETILHDSLFQVIGLSSMELRSEFHIIFKGENSQDAGGLTKEWLGLLVKELFNDQIGLFRLSQSQEQRYFATAHNDSTEYYILAGIAIGKAIFENIPLDCALCPTLLKHLLGQECTFIDLKHQDEDIYNSLMYMEKSSIDGILFESFTVPHNGQSYRITEDGENIQVTDDNKDTYILLRTEYELYGSMYNAIESLKSGLYRIVPQEFISSLSTDELDYMICGNPVINLKDWKKHTEYSGEYSSSHKVIVWFWDVVNVLHQKQLRDLLQFITGTSRVPIDGFAGLKTLRGDPACFKIVSVEYYRSALPRAHTCFNRLDLPLYPNKSYLKSALECVLANHTLGFGLE
jgi:hypothetical protein